MKHAWHALTQALAWAILLSACTETEEAPSSVIDAGLDGSYDASQNLDTGLDELDGSHDASTAPDASADAGTVPSCGDRLKLPLPWRTEIDFGASFPRGHWQLGDGDAGTAGAAAPITAAALAWRGATASTLPVRCSLTPDDCTVGGSRVQLEGAAGDVIVQLHWEPAQLAAIADGTRVVLDADPGSGELVLKTDDGKLLLGVVRYGGGGHAGYAARNYQLGPLQVASGDAICSAANDQCNYLETAQSVVITAGSARVVLAPAERAELTIEGVRYELINHVAVQHGSARSDVDTCAALRPALDSITVLRVP